ncbi:bifunctional 5,10-methylenetetrahydrofolate dehydrogenase/5,10-methenyltetrahydrofolate cyclohydrolase [Paenibacillus protaetiae]|uniref:Bifunctional protein FolD n=1 Tax=Paenibacillus protaetiae TaxID=2509456 RepID=A0A4P6EVD2_9BACL|nr:bifunctional 5,10-methylenetetrahydrofolate dehydrogenase/5,10-methenyltetrahydrofolate cyclohydrolase [Paenibacillus protaetiae]QAY66954.1 bifunctional 5,10-methylenetetrahydrofolate dehydrogenase/5,10-methenyltetrahydrofolate cyclohydrolase [Paenibacillus protaetiae]
MADIYKAKEAAEAVYETIKHGVADWKRQGITPRIATLLVEGDPASAYYAEAKRKTAGKLGISFELHSFKADVSEAELLQCISRLNENPDVHGIMLELPLPKHLNPGTIEAAIAPTKDVDGVTPANKLATVTGAAGLYPATPQACIKLVKHYGHKLEGVNVTLVGCGRTVGLPLFHLLQREHATVTVCHAYTPDLTPHLKQAAISFVAVGNPGTVTKEMVHPGLVLIDAGINETADGSIVGDVAADAGQHAAAYSPVPGGVGTLTTAVLFENLLKAIQLQTERNVNYEYAHFV